jgi:ATP-dependent protease ClpP protease subunit
LIVPDPNFRANPDRAVFIQGEINQQLVDRLTPAILHLQGGNRLPITVYIDSPGGSVSDAKTILRLLRAPCQDHLPPCQIITVAASRAGSAAADLLSSGDYATALPGSTILYHGIRRFPDSPLTVEYTSVFTDYLRMVNDVFATELADRVERRFMFRFLLLQTEIKTTETIVKNAQDRGVDHVLTLMSERLSGTAKALFQNAISRRTKYELLLKAVSEKTPNAGGKTPAEVEADQIKAIVDFELDTNRGNSQWAFQSGGLRQLNDDFFLLYERLADPQGERLRRFCATLGAVALSPTENQEIEALPKAEREEAMIGKVGPRLEPLRTFFVALCHSLQRGENELTARDAYWLGLIDEVIGAQDLPSLRNFAEYKPDQVQPKPVEPTTAAPSAPPTEK